MRVLYIDVKSDVSSVVITASLEDEKSTFVKGYGPRTVSLKNGFNSFLIKVKSEKGNIKTYTINITRDDGRSKNNNLSSIICELKNEMFTTTNTSVIIRYNEKYNVSSVTFICRFF